MITSVLVFSTNLIQFLQLDTKQKQIVTSFSQQLPTGLIQRGKITNLEQVQQIVGQLLTQIKTKLMYIELVIPEDAVVSKSLELPNLPNHEIDEAVRWEAEGVLHFPLGAAVLDWKRLFSNGNYHVLMQAVPQEIVDEYLAVATSSNLIVQTISTPALGLVTLAEQKPGVRLLMYVGPSDTILTLTREQEVIATSIVPDNKTNSIVQTIQRMIHYYDKFPIEWIQVGGVGLNNELITALKAFKLPVTGFTMPVSVNTETANTYLLAISVAVAPIAPPSDQGTINLLPQWYDNQERKKRQFSFWKQLLLIFATFSLVITAALGGCYFWLSRLETSFLTQQNLPSSVTKEALESASQANNLSRLALALETTDYFPTKAINQIKDLAGDTITLGRVELQLSEQKGTVMGLAKSRDGLLAFKQALEQLPGIAEVQLPVSSFVEETDLPFQLYLTFAKEPTTLLQEEDAK
ncbi:pilus assembly protein PilM [Candidatus Beckwithbacteria bacterium]|nr:pilus assembly protein PilM [Candidatus Beckwithbacteria bacterium]